MPGRRVRELFHGQVGYSAVEYVILLGLLTLVVSGGAAWLGVSTMQVLSPLAGATTGQPPTSSAASNASDTGGLAGTEASRIKVTTESGNRFRPVLWGGISLAVGAIGIGCFLWRHRRGRAHEPIPQDDCELSDLAERFCTKRQRLLRLLSEDPGILFKNQLAVRHLMTTDMITVPLEATWQHVDELMRKSRVRHLLVCDSGQRLLGVVSDRDLKGKRGNTAGELMNSRVQTISSDTLISPATTHIVQAGISSLPVVDGGHLCGILTTTDLILALQCLLQLWIHITSTMNGVLWEQEFVQAVQSQLDADTCYGLKSVIDSLMESAQAGP